MNLHDFFIPVMGTSFTIDTPLKVAKYGISSVMSIIDDELCEEMRKFYQKGNFVPIDISIPNSRSERILAYLNYINAEVQAQFHKLLGMSLFDEHANDLLLYITMLPDKSPIKVMYRDFLEESDFKKKNEIEKVIKKSLKLGSLDVNIMTKIDALQKEGDLSLALAALDGFARSSLSSSVVFSAGFNRSLYSSVAKYDDFFPNEYGYLKKKVIIKVSDYRSAIIQGRFLAKKGIWVSEYRVESGLNCGGHVFPTEGLLMGPILEEFALKRNAMTQELFSTVNRVLDSENRPLFADVPQMKLTVQGGIGTYEEILLLFKRYGVDQVGIGSPFLLVSEVTSLDDDTRNLIARSDREAFFMSGYSPLGANVMFNTIKGTSSSKYREDRILKGNPGSPCPKGYLVSNTEFSKRKVCTASSFYQKKKLAQIDSQHSDDRLKKRLKERVLEKTCLCEDLAAASLNFNKISNGRPLKTAICPGPNVAYFSKVVSMIEMISHFYGRLQLIVQSDRKHMFLAELEMYIDYLKFRFDEYSFSSSSDDVTRLNIFVKNLKAGVTYYISLFSSICESKDCSKNKLKEDLLLIVDNFQTLVSKYKDILPEGTRDMPFRFSILKAFS